MSEHPALHTQVFDARLLVAAMESPGTAVFAARYYSDRIFIHVAAEQREIWLKAEQSIALPEDFPIHPTHIEVQLRKLASQADLQWMALNNGAGALVLWRRGKHILDVCPEDYRPEVLDELSRAERARPSEPAAMIFAAA